MSSKKYLTNEIVSFIIGNVISNHSYVPGILAPPPRFYSAHTPSSDMHI